MAQENYFTVRGTLYDKKSIDIPGKKDPTQTYKKVLLTLEVDSSGDRKRGDQTVFVTEKNLLKFEVFSPKFDIDSFMIKDFIEIRFFIEGKEYEIKDGDRKGQKGLVNRNIITFMKYADLDGGHSNHKGKITVDAMSDTKDLAPKRDTVFTAPDPDEEDYKDLPFILTALIGIGSLMMF